MLTLIEGPPRTQTAAPERTLPRPEHPRACALCALDAEDRSVSHARKFTMAQLAGWQVSSEVVDAACIVVSELVTNAVRHSGTADVDLRLARCYSDASEVSLVWIEVADHGQWRDHDSPYEGGLHCDDDNLEDGRGLFLVAALALRSGVLPPPTGTCAWALLSEPQA